MRGEQVAVRVHGAADAAATGCSCQVCGRNGNTREVGPYSHQGTASHTVMTQELQVERPSSAVSGFEGVGKSLAWDSMGQLMPLGFVPQSTNPFVTPSVQPQALRMMAEVCIKRVS